MKFQLFIVAVFCVWRVNAWWPEFMSSERGNGTESVAHQCQCANGTDSAKKDPIAEVLQDMKTLLQQHSYYHGNHSVDLATLKTATAPIVNMSEAFDRMEKNIAVINETVTLTGKLTRDLHDEMMKTKKRTSTVFTWFGMSVRVFLCMHLAQYRWRDALTGAYCLLILSCGFSIVVTTSFTRWLVAESYTASWSPVDLDSIAQFLVYTEAFVMAVKCVVYFNREAQNEKASEERRAQHEKASEERRANTDAIRGLGVLHAATNPTLDTAHANVQIVQSAPIKHIPAQTASSYTPIQHLPPPPAYDGGLRQSNVTRFLARRS